MAANDPAYPCIGPKSTDAALAPGLTKREAMALEIMNGLVASPMYVVFSDTTVWFRQTDAQMAAKARALADALLTDLAAHPSA